ncbi:MAG: TIGR02679 domain-containing protein [Kineosporiaceae bacterium]
MSGPPPWVSDPALGGLWRAVAHRLERTGRVPTGTVRVPLADGAVRRAVTGLTGRPVPGGTATVDLAELDADLRRRAGSGLVQVVETLVGPVRDRPAERAARDAARRGPVEEVLARWRSRPDLAAQSWVPEWAELLAADGTVLKRGVTGADLLVALDLVARLAAGELAGRRRTEVAARVLGDAHALDEGRLLTALVVRALAARRGLGALPDTAAGRRDLWEAVGVSVDRVSTSCLVVGLVPAAGTPGRGRWVAAADRGDPVHVTGWDLDRTAAWRPHAGAAEVLVTENPTVLEAFARHRPGVPVACVSGHPRAVVLELLARIDGATLRYHGDFDAAGLHIAHRLAVEHGLMPWAMSARDYAVAARASMPPLTGALPPTPWDPALAVRMAEVGVAVHEEVVLDDLLTRWPG